MIYQLGDAVVGVNPPADIASGRAHIVRWTMVLRRPKRSVDSCWQYHKLKICEVICRKIHTILTTFFIDIVYNIFNGNSAGTRRIIFPVPALEPNEHKLLFVHLAYG